MFAAALSNIFLPACRCPRAGSEDRVGALDGPVVDGQDVVDVSGRRLLASHGARWMVLASQPSL